MRLVSRADNLLARDEMKHCVYYHANAQETLGNEQVDLEELSARVLLGSSRRRGPAAGREPPFQHGDESARRRRGRGGVRRAHARFLAEVYDSCATPTS